MSAKKAWAWGRCKFAGLDHLEGKTVTVLAEGNVAPDVVVTGGAITIQTPSTVVHAGLPYTSDIVTLDLAIIGKELLLDKRKLVTAVRAQVETTRGLKAGIPGRELTELKQRSTEGYSDSVSPKTGTMTVRILGTWNDSGSVQISQTYPLPAHILSVLPEVNSGGMI